MTCLLHVLLRCRFCCVQCSAMDRLFSVHSINAWPGCDRCNHKWATAQYRQWLFYPFAHTHTHRQRERERETQHSGHIPYYNSITHFELHMCVRCCAVSQCIIWYTQDMNLTFYRKTITIVRLVVVADVDHLHRVPLLASSANALPRHITHIMAYLSLIMYMILMSHTTHITPFLHRFWSTLKTTVCERKAMAVSPWCLCLSITRIAGGDGCVGDEHRR